MWIDSEGYGVDPRLVPLTNSKNKLNLLRHLNDNFKLLVEARYDHMYLSVA